MNVREQGVLRRNLSSSPSASNMCFHVGDTLPEVVKSYYVHKTIN